MIVDVAGFVADNPGLTMQELVDAGCPRSEVLRLRSSGRIVPFEDRSGAYTRDRFYPYGTRGRDISCMEALVDLEENPELVRIIDTETTGIRPGEDKILQLSVLDGNGVELFDSYIHPYGVSSWPEAQRINGISSEMVRDSPSMAELRPRIEETLAGAALIIGYNVSFDLSFLEAAGVVIPVTDVCDVMEDFAPVAGEWAEWANGGAGGWKWQKLTACAGHYGFDFKAHDSLEDCRATLHCCRRIGWDQVDDRELVRSRDLRCSTTLR